MVESGVRNGQNEREKMALNRFVLGVKSDICFVTKIKKWDLPFFFCTFPYLYSSFFRGSKWI